MYNLGRCKKNQIWSLYESYFLNKPISWIPQCMRQISHKASFCNRISELCSVSAIRKLTEKRRRVEGKLERRDIVTEYADSGSQVYAPMTRIGVFLDRGSEQYVVKSRYLNSYQGKWKLIYQNLFKDMLGIQ